MADSGWIGVDLDGTLASYDVSRKDTWDGSSIEDPVPSIVNLVKGMLSAGCDVRILTARVSPNSVGANGNHDTVEKQMDVIDKWCEFHIGRRLPITCSKDYNMVLLIDDRAVSIDRGLLRYPDEQLTIIQRAITSTAKDPNMTIDAIDASWGLS